MRAGKKALVGLQLDDSSVGLLQHWEAWAALDDAVGLMLCLLKHVFSSELRTRTFSLPCTSGLQLRESSIGVLLHRAAPASIKEAVGPPSSLQVQYLQVKTGQKMPKSTGVLRTLGLCRNAVQAGEWGTTGVRNGRALFAQLYVACT